MTVLRPAIKRMVIEYRGGLVLEVEDPPSIDEGIYHLWRVYLAHSGMLGEGMVAAPGMLAEEE